MSLKTNEHKAVQFQSVGWEVAGRSEIQEKGKKSMDRLRGRVVHSTNLVRGSSLLEKWR